MSAPERRPSPAAPPVQLHAGAQPAEGMIPQYINLYDVEAAARQRLSRRAYGYYASGAHDEITVRENGRAYDRIFLRPRVLVDVSHRDLSTVVLGSRVAAPILVAPTAFQRMAHPEGEVATARAAGAMGTVMILSTLSNSTVEEVRPATDGPLWFQLYVFRDRGVTRALVERVQDAGCQALVLTVDTPVLGRRESDVREQFQLPSDLSIANLAAATLDALPSAPGESGLAAYFVQAVDPSLSWPDLDWLCSITRLPVLVKGVVRGDDAARAVDHGAAGVVVSNHGGRQLDTAVPTIHALPDVVEAVGGRTEILIDGGVRRGTDVVKAIALGAKAVLIGRPILWGLAVGGERGVRDVLQTLRDEFDLAMALCGCVSVDEIDRTLIA